jgi:TetR/AcrR family transcriptional repressor of nem operon
MGPRKTTTRERLITTAAELFWRQGYAQTGVNEIIQQAGATSGSFYHFFPAKEDLLLAVVDHMSERLQTEVFEGSDDDDPIDRLFSILSAYRRHLASNDFVFGSPLANLAAEVSENHPQARTRLTEVVEGWVSQIEDLLAEAAHRLPADTDRGTLARFVVSAMEGAVLQARVSRSAVPFDASVAQLRTHFDLLQDHIELPKAPRPPVRPTPRRETSVGDWKAW